jgi:long-subunit fatty acid transport protein
MTFALLSLVSGARAASLDLLEVGGAFGTPGATNPSALWWNPAGLAVGGGTQVMLEAAPTFATVKGDRANPDYGEVTPQDGFPESYDYGGTDTLKFDGVVPFFGVSSDLTLPGLGVGLGVMVPTAHGGNSDQQWGANRYALREGSIQALHVTGAVSYQLLGKVAAGLSVSFVDSSWYADTDSTTYPDLGWEIAAFGGTPEPPATFQDAYIEDRGYTSTLIFGGEDAQGDRGALKDQAVTLGGGVYVTPIDKLGISLAFNKGVKLEHEGDLTMKFQCPPDHDTISRFATELTGLCTPEGGAVFEGTGKIGYSLPSRFHLGVVVSPIEKVRLEAMGAYVMWSEFTDFDITTEIAADQVDVEDPVQAEETAELVSQNRLWARANKDTFWAGVDGKVQVNRFFTGGLRVIYDKSAIPDSVLSLNNYDANTVMVTGLAMFTPIKQLGIGASYGHYFLATRNVTDSAYAVNLAQANPAADDYYAGNPQLDRYFYPSANGNYSGSIDRIGVVVKAQFMKDSPSW